MVEGGNRRKERKSAKQVDGCCGPHISVSATQALRVLRDCGLQAGSLRYSRLGNLRYILKIARKPRIATFLGDWWLRSLGREPSVLLQAYRCPAA